MARECPVAKRPAPSASCRRADREAPSTCQGHRAKTLNGARGAGPSEAQLSRRARAGLRNSAGFNLSQSGYGHVCVCVRAR
eukprot:8916692-Alexandrium_andersonii.AAC.1